MLIRYVRSLFMKGFTIYLTSQNYAACTEQLNSEINNFYKVHIDNRRRNEFPTVLTN